MKTLMFFMLIALLLCATSILAQSNIGNSTETGSQKANYMLARSVIGSGGVLGAHNDKYIHSATAGQTVVGGAHNDKYVLLAGYWNTIFMMPPNDVISIDDPEIPDNFELHQNYPNPFNPQTSIQFELPQPCLVAVEIYNVMGQRIRLIEKTNYAAGIHEVTWDGRDDSSSMMGTGIYLFRILVLDEKQKTPLFQQTRKMLFIK